MPDEDTSITIPVKNNGLTNCGEGKVQIIYNGNVIGQADLEAGITSGETQNVTVDLTVPGDAAAKETLKVEAISDKIQQQILQKIFSRPEVNLRFLLNKKMMILQ